MQKPKTRPKSNTKHIAKYNIERYSIDFSSDTLTPTLAFLRLARAGRKAFLLESVEGGERLGRYSFLGIDPRETLRIHNGRATVERDGISVVLDGHPFQALARYLTRYRAERRPGLPPLQGGAIGFLGYECASLVEEKIPVSPATKEDRDRDQACMMVFGDVIAFDHVRRRVFVICNIFTEEEPLKQGLARAKERAEKIRDQLFTKSRDERPMRFDETGTQALADVKAVMGEKSFVEAARKVKSHIRAGDIFQCVLSDQFTLDVKAQPFTVYRALQATNPSPYLFYLSFGEDTLLGASPEMLVKCQNGVLETCPIAGTRPRGANETSDRANERDLLRSVKERAEHLMLVDLGRNDLGRVAKPGSVHVKRFMQVERYSHVMHLVSLVEGKLKPKLTPFDALAGAFPAGTLSGAPKIRAMQIIAELEPVRRNTYGGAVVYYDFGGDLDSCITIRSLYIRGRKAIAQAGAGIVADSRPEAEYAEVLQKLKAVRRAVALANGATP